MVLYIRLSATSNPPLVLAMKTCPAVSASTARCWPPSSPSSALARSPARSRRPTLLYMSIPALTGTYLRPHASYAIGRSRRHVVQSASTAKPLLQQEAEDEANR
ncbi:hypothetical protein FRC08_014885 [Ceratobasidium sp. 394]|nr:hypothetical protein FRC08_014885 [Ceratobasidium sp. 394]